MADDASMDDASSGADDDDHAPETLERPRSPVPIELHGQTLRQRPRAIPKALKNAGIELEDLQAHYDELDQTDERNAQRVAMRRYNERKRRGKRPAHDSGRAKRRAGSQTDARNHRRACIAPPRKPASPGIRTARRHHSPPRAAPHPSPPPSARPPTARWRRLCPPPAHRSCIIRPGFEVSRTAISMRKPAGQRQPSFRLHSGGRADLRGGTVYL